MRNHKLSFDKIWLILSLLLFLGSGLVLFSGENFFINNEKIEKKFIGKLKSKNNLVKRRHEGSLIWETVENQETLYVNDYIFTNQDSTASLDLVVDTKISMSPSSLIKLQHVGESLNLNIIEGLTIAKLGAKSDLVIVSGKTRIRAGGKDTEVQLENGKIQVNKGFIILDKEGRKSTIEKDQFVDLKSQVISKYTLKPITPKLSSTTHLRKENNVEFKWKDKDSVLNYHLAIAKDAKFKDVFYSSPIKKTSVIVYDLPQGTLYWRVKSKKGSKISYGPTSYFTVKKNKRLNLFTPQDYKVYNRNLIKSSFLNWQQIKKVKYELEIYQKSTQGWDLVKHDLISNNKYALKIHNLGTFRWRVRVDSLEWPNPRWSNFNHYKVQNSDIELQKPIFILPIAGSQTPKDIGEQIDISWGGSSDSPYELHLAKDPNFEEILSIKDVEGASTEILNSEWGEYYIKVREKSNYKNQKGPFSDVLKISLAPRVPNYQYPMENEFCEIKNGDQINIQWEKNERVGEYHIQISKSPEFDELEFDETTSDNSVAWEPDDKSSDYFWRIKYASESGHISEFTHSIPFFVKTKSPPKLVIAKKEKKVRGRIENLNKQPTAVVNMFSDRAESTASADDMKEPDGIKYIKSRVALSYNPGFINYHFVTKQRTEGTTKRNTFKSFMGDFEVYFNEPVKIEAAHKQTYGKIWNTLDTKSDSRKSAFSEIDVKLINTHLSVAYSFKFEDTLLMNFHILGNWAKITSLGGSTSPVILEENYYGGGTKLSLDHFATETFTQQFEAFFSYGTYMTYGATYALYYNFTPWVFSMLGGDFSRTKFQNSIDTDTNFDQYGGTIGGGVSF
ncbi:MAG: hypothetical protein HOE90_24710 [Bacteriovoracaceae bacterium]|jgi:hypothetical protein|nr:hypothetical protein [Bacteriovoracaceae bacterium]